MTKLYRVPELLADEYILKMRWKYSDRRRSAQGARWFILQHLLTPEEYQAIGWAARALEDTCPDFENCTRGCPEAVALLNDLQEIMPSSQPHVDPDAAS
jgi:hypothetical protein